jgi:hypothetical protein
MPKFFFTYRTGDHLARDLEGIELPSPTAARAYCRNGKRPWYADVQSHWP